MDMREVVAGGMSGLEKLINKIPGYHGYKEKEMRRDADKLLRDHIYGVLTEQRQPDLGEHAGRFHPTPGNDEVSRLSETRRAGLLSAELQRKVGFNSGAEIAVITVVEPPATLFSLLIEQIAHHPPFALPVHASQEVEKHQVFGGNGHVGFQLQPPVSLRVLGFQKEPGRLLHHLLNPHQPWFFDAQVGSRRPSVPQTGGVGWTFAENRARWCRLSLLFLPARCHTIALCTV